MGIFNKFVEPQPDQPNLGDEEMVLVCVPKDDFDAMVQISDKLTEAIEAYDLGMFDGNEIGEGETILFMYGPDAERLFAYIEPILREDEFCRGATVRIRRGGLGAPQRDVTL